MLRTGSEVLLAGLPCGEGQLGQRVSSRRIRMKPRKNAEHRMPNEHVARMAMPLCPRCMPGHLGDNLRLIAHIGW